MFNLQFSSSHSKNYLNIGAGSRGAPAVGISSTFADIQPTQMYPDTQFMYVALTMLKRLLYICYTYCTIQTKEPIALHEGNSVFQID